MSTEQNTHNTQLAAHESLSDFLTRMGVGGDLESEMKPERIGYGILENLTVGIRMFKKPSSVGQPVVAAGCAIAGCTEESTVSSVVSGNPSTADVRRFLRWLSDSLDTDTPVVNLRVQNDEGDTQLVQNAARRLATQAFA